MLRYFTSYKWQRILEMIKSILFLLPEEIGSWIVRPKFLFQKLVLSPLVIFLFLLSSLACLKLGRKNEFVFEPMKSLFNCPGPFLPTYCTRHSLRVPWFFPLSVFFHIALLIHFFCDNVLELDNFSPQIGIYVLLSSALCWSFSWNMTTWLWFATLAVPDYLL